MKIAILGTNGFIGKSLHRYFTLTKESIVLNVGGKKNANLCDQNDPIFYELERSDYEVLIHAAANTSGSNVILSNPVAHVYPNFLMNNHVFNAAVKNQYVKHIIWFSCTVMYVSSYGPQSETDFTGYLNPASPYFGVANMKVATENLCQFYSEITDKKFTAIRHSNVFGPGDKYTEDGHICATLIKKIHAAKNGDVITLKGTGLARRDLLYIDDLCNFIGLATQQKNNFEIYNVGGGESITVKELAEVIANIMGKNILFQFDSSAKSIETQTVISCKKARSHYSWAPQQCLYNSLVKAIDYYRIYGK
jgi:nucleoside-diphosphate-sugar epimerase